MAKKQKQTDSVTESDEPCQNISQRALDDSAPVCLLKIQIENRLDVSHILYIHSSFSPYVKFKYFTIQTLMLLILWRLIGGLCRTLEGEFGAKALWETIPFKKQKPVSTLSPAGFIFLIFDFRAIYINKNQR